MKEISNWDSTTRRLKLDQAQKIAEYNKKYFFSQEFSVIIHNELRQNLSNALVEVEKTNTAQAWMTRRRKLATVDEIRNILTGTTPHPNFNSNPEYFKSCTRKNIAKIVAMARKLQNQKNSC